MERAVVACAGRANFISTSAARVRRVRRLAQRSRTAFGIVVVIHPKPRR